jgi:hypothetical protein
MVRQRMLKRALHRLHAVSQLSLKKHPMDHSNHVGVGLWGTLDVQRSQREASQLCVCVTGLYSGWLVMSFLSIR